MLIIEPDRNTLSVIVVKNINYYKSVWGPDVEEGTPHLVRKHLGNDLLEILVPTELVGKIKPFKKVIP